MSKFFDMMGMAFSNQPFLSVFLVAAITFLLYLIYDYRNFRFDQTSRQVSSRIGTEKKEKRKFSITDLSFEFIKKHEEKVKLKLEQARILFTIQEYFNMMMIAIGIGFFIGFVLFPMGGLWKALAFLAPGGILKVIAGRFLAGVAFGAAGYFIPTLWIYLQIRKRRKALENQIQDALLNIADALKSGHVIGKAIEIVGEEMKYPIGPEFKRAHSEIEAGKSLPEALTELKERIELADFDMAVNAILIQYEVGGKLEPLLRNMVHIIQQRMELRKEIEKSISSSKTVGVVLMIAPVFFVVVFSALNKESYIMMFKSIIGLIMIAIAIICYIVAAFFIFYIINDVSKEAR